MIRVFPDAATVAYEAAGMFAEQAWLAIGQRKRFTVALSGGNTPRDMYERLAEAPFREAVDWQRVHVFWGDERCLPENDTRRNARMAGETLLDHVPIPPDQVHPLVCHADPQAAADGYAKLLGRLFEEQPPVFDLVLLGLGQNGHTASLFPYAPALVDQSAWTAAVYVKAQDMYRVTLMPSVINRARLVVFLVVGSDKAGILRQVKNGTSDPLRLPAQLIQPTYGKPVWLVDREAAAKLTAYP